MNDVVKVLAVADPAVFVYTDKKYNILDHFKKAKVEFDIVEWENYYPAMMNALEGKSEYDIVMVAGHLWLYDFVKKGFLSEMDEHDDDVLPIISNEMKCDGKTYLSPSFCDGHMVVYRKSILNEANIHFSDIITVDELISAVKELTEFKNGMYPICLKAHPSEIFLDALPYLRDSKTDIYDGNKVNVNHQQVINGLKKYLSLREYAPKDTNTYGNNELKQAIAQKKTAIGVTWSGQMGVVLDENCMEPEDLGFATFLTAWNVTWSFGICNSSKKKDLTKELLKYLVSEPIDQLVGEYCGAPVRKSNYIKGINSNKHKWYNCQLKMIEKCAKPLPNIENAGEKNGILYEEIYQSFIGNKDAETALNNAQNRIDSMK